MRGHWISQTRKLNKHYQNGGPQEKMAGAIIRSVSALHAFSMPFVWRINQETGARELRLGLCAGYSLQASDGQIVTIGRTLYQYWDEEYVDGLVEEGETNEWVLLDFIPHMEINIYYGNPITGSRTTYINTRDKTKFEINTGRIKTTVEELTFKNFTDYGEFAWTDYYGTQTLEPFNTLPVSISGVCVWVRKDQMNYNTTGKYYTLSTPKCKELLDEVNFGVQFYRKNITTARIRVRSTGIGYPYFTSCPFEGDFNGIEKIYNHRSGEWEGWATANGNWRQSGLNGEVITRSYETADSGTMHKISNKSFSRFVYDVLLVLPYKDIFTLMQGMNPCNNATVPTTASFSCNGTYIIPKEDEELFVPYGNINAQIKNEQYCDIYFTSPDKIWTMRGISQRTVGKQLYKIVDWYRSTTGFWRPEEEEDHFIYHTDTIYVGVQSFYSSNAITASSEVHYEG